MIRRTAALLPLVILPALFACKARTDQGSAVKAEGDAAAPDLAEFFSRFDTDVAVVEGDYFAGGPGNPDSVEGLALAGGGNAAGDAVAEALALADKLKAMANETVIEKRVEVEAMAIELEAMAQLMQTDLAGDYQARIDAALQRVRAILDAPPPKKTEVVAAKPKPPVEVVKPVAVPSPKVDYDRLTCEDLGDGSVLPKVIATGTRLGVRSNPGAKGFNNAKNCWDAIAVVQNHLVCSLSPANKISPYNTMTGRMFGPEIGYEMTGNCVMAVLNSRGSPTICLVDNRPGVQKFAKFSLATGQAIDWWFDTQDKCRAGDKSPDPRTTCIEDCKSTYSSCKSRAGLLSDRLTKMNKELDCMLAELKCTDKC